MRANFTRVFMQRLVLPVALLCTRLATSWVHADDTSPAAGYPWINLAPKPDLAATDYDRLELARWTAPDGSRPLSLASADFDEDGVPDLAAGFATRGGGAIILRRGNLDAHHPHTGAAKQRKALGRFTDAPFLGALAELACSISPDAIAALDFNADGNQDVVAGEWGAASLDVFAGNGDGTFDKPIAIPLAGNLTTLATGEVNRRDGLLDLVVAVAGGEGPRVLVYESAQGAGGAPPEIISAPSNVTGLAIEDLNRDAYWDIAASCGETLVIVWGRDRLTSASAEERARVPKPNVTKQPLAYKAVAIAAGDFEGDRDREIALLSANGTLHLIAPDGSAERQFGEPLPRRNDGDYSNHLLVPARVSTHPKQDLIVADPASPQLLIYSEPVGPDAVRWPVPNPVIRESTYAGAILPMNLNGDAIEDLVLLAQSPDPFRFQIVPPGTTFVVNSTGGENDPNINGVCDVDDDDSNGLQCTLNGAIGEANGIPDLDEIHFNVGGGGFVTLAGVLSTVGQPVNILGTTQPGYFINPIVDVPALVIRGGNSTIKGLLFSNSSLEISSPSLATITGINKVENCYFGTDSAGMNRLGVIRQSIFIRDSFGNTLGGTTAEVRNLIQGLRIERVDSELNLVLGNYFGADINLVSPFANVMGIVVEAPMTTIGSQAAGGDNVISGSDDAGITVSTLNVPDGTVVGTMIQNNIIGAATPTTVQLGNLKAGVFIRSGVTTNTLIGGTVVEARNVISGNNLTTETSDGNAGIDIEQSAGGVIIQGNIIGLDETGMVAIPNRRGIHIANSSNHRIGGIIPVAGAGIARSGDLPPRPVVNVGTPPGNIISGNDEEGIRIFGFSQTMSGVRVEGNLIGTAIDGMTGVGNGRFGVSVSSAGTGAVEGTVIGGNEYGARNVISANGTGTISVLKDGIQLSGPGVSGTQIKANHIGVNRDGDATLPNQRHGIAIIGSSNNFVGGLSVTNGSRTPGRPPGNVISGNMEDGVFISQLNLSGNLIDAASNQIFGNMIGVSEKNFGLVAADVGNTGNGIRILNATMNLIGATDLGSGNHIDDNLGDGILITGAAAGSTAIRSNDIGVQRSNGGDGIELNNSSNNVVQGNRIGIFTSVGNVKNGVLLTNGATQNLIGGLGMNEANTIEKNLESGVAIVNTSSRGNQILSNRFFDNGFLAIDLIGFGQVTPNDDGDADDGPNALQNFPEFLGADSASVQGRLNSTPNTLFTIQIYKNSTGFDPSNHGEGEELIATVTTMTDDMGIGTFNATGLTIAPGDCITGTATNMTTMNTSEFAECITSLEGQLDWGDAPDPTYPTLAENNGARHLVGGNFRLGASVDDEMNGQPTAEALGDDEDGNDDDDGVTFPDGPIVIGSDVEITVSVELGAGTGFLNAWIDLNGDGDWGDNPTEEMNEHVIVDFELAQGDNPITITIPEGAAEGMTFARFRLDRNGGLDFDGAAASGEVEDYRIQLIFEPETTVVDFTEGGGNDQGWAGGAVPGFGGTTEVNSNGLCMTVPGPGSNFTLWVSPEQLVELIGQTIFCVRLELSTDQVAPDAIPLFFFVYDNFISSGGGNNYGGFFWILDVDGGAQGIGRLQGRTSFTFYIVPIAHMTPQWMAGAFTAQADLENDFRFQYRVIDDNETLITDADSGTICIARVEVTAIPRNRLPDSAVVFNPPISTSTHFAQAQDEIGTGVSFSMIDDATNTARYQLLTIGDVRKTFGYFDPTQPNLNTQLFPIQWMQESIYRTRARIRAELNQTDPIDVIFISNDTTTNELGAVQYITRGAPGGPMDGVASPKLSAIADYEAYVFGQNSTLSMSPNADLLRPLVIFFNTGTQAGDGTGGDATIIDSLEVDKLNSLPNGNGGL